MPNKEPEERRLFVSGVMIDPSTYISGEMIIVNRPEPKEFQCIYCGRVRPVKEAWTRWSNIRTDNCWCDRCEAKKKKSK